MKSKHWNAGRLRGLMLTLAILLAPLLGLAPAAHAAAATPHLTFACDTHYPWTHSEDEVVAGGRVPIVDGGVKIPDRPGLGVELDPDRLARARERYQRCPYRRRDDEAEMRKHVDPQWKRVLPRW
jgi:glucarate dehydratase